MSQVSNESTAMMVEEEFDEGGSDTEGRTYTSLKDMWQYELGKTFKKSNKPASGSVDQWYGKAADYWQNIEATINGVLGGFGHLHDDDIAESTQFLQNLIQSKHLSTQRALDAGAGIGRVSKSLLIPLFDKVDLVEQCANFVDAAKTYVNDPKLDNYICCGLQDFTPEPEKYDLIHIQWVLNYLTDGNALTILLLFLFTDTSTI
eukprot:GEZU01000938.1.p1 GENE.GEZU01000938.1~~GEZU01000938.1.p1  ORF type:complete len:204 (+),score=42.64 GEZU01000938.1:158-769(+)